MACIDIQIGDAGVTYRYELLTMTDRPRESIQRVAI